MLEERLLESLSVFTKGARSLSVTTVFAFYLFNSKGNFINEENPFLIGAVTGAVCACGCV